MLPGCGHVNHKEPAGPGSNSLSASFSSFFAVLFPLLLLCSWIFFNTYDLY